VQQNNRITGSLPHIRKPEAANRRGEQHLEMQPTPA
jgi:hypothetical protein